MKSTKSGFGAKRRGKKVTVFRLGMIWVFKCFIGDEDLFRDLADYYKRDRYRFEFETMTERDDAASLLEQKGFSVDLVEDLNGYVVSMNKFDKYASILRNSVEFAETQDARVFLMKNKVSVEEALDFGAEIYEGTIPF